MTPGSARVPPSYLLVTAPALNQQRTLTVPSLSQANRRSALLTRRWNSRTTSTRPPTSSSKSSPGSFRL